ncbi:MULTISPECIES: hypothetical protein [unclassified Synechococcus]|nr:MULTISPECIES: hypothetical protein [unclassified Synechococcus]MCP9842706.1 hypothetical protein [Synechococcus sp. Edmonson 11F2]MCP9855371.1 hypothetical protein [Synechococcus sp. Cruz-9C9]MCP9862382.1 hypothetical protein [Synechococcus sp. Cruz-7E5]MCP9869654.1 hypothetical protein [Synechococcus sp. Cruz-7B9]
MNSGLLELLISPIDAARLDDHAGKVLLESRDLDQLMQTLMGDQGAGD